MGRYRQIARRGYRAAKRYGPYIKQGIKLLNKFGGSGTKTKRKSYKSGSGVTNQFDRQTQYRRKRAPRSIRKKAKRSRRNHEWNILKDLAPQTAVRNSTLSGSWLAGVTNQFAVNCCIYGLNGVADNSSDAGFQDVSVILNADGQSDNAFEKVIFSTAILDLTYTNTSTVQFTQEVDVYEIIFTRQNSGTRLLGDYNAAFAATPVTGGGTAVTDFSFRGMTPFECPLASAQGYKVMKKTKYFVSSGNCFTYQIKDKSNKWLQGQQWKNASAANEAQWAYKTRNILFIAKPIAGTPAGNAGSFSVGCTRKYLYKVMQENAAGTITI